MNKKFLVTTLAAFALAVGLLAAPVGLAGNTTLAAKAPAVAAVVDSQVAPAAAAVSVCRDYRSRTNTLISARRPGSTVYRTYDLAYLCAGWPDYQNVQHVWTSYGSIRVASVCYRANYRVYLAPNVSRTVRTYSKAGCVN